MSPRKDRSSTAARSPALALRAADAFRDLSRHFLSAMPQDMDPSLSYVTANAGGLIASATNLALAVEIYLKTLQMLLSVPVQQTHDLLGLFSSLPQPAKESLLRAYDEIELPSQRTMTCIGLQLSTHPLTHMPAPDTSDHSLRSVLGRSKDAFVTWRYLYEQGDETVSSFGYEFCWLDNAATVFRGMIIEIFRHLRGTEHGMTNG